jgi:hypothetical protein
MVDGTWTCIGSGVRGFLVTYRGRQRTAAGNEVLRMLEVRAATLSQS